MIKTYESIAAISREASRLNTFVGDYAGSYNRNWYGNESAEDTRHFAEVGDSKLVPDAEKLIDQLDTQIEVPRRVWERSPAGAFCVVPDVLAGLPTYMRYQREVGDEHAPIAIIACSTISAGVDSRTIRKRGTTILALVLALARVRPISLHTVATTGAENGDRDETVLCTRIETAPLDLSMACWALTSPGFARRMNYSVAAKINGFVTGWPRRFEYRNQQPYMDYLRDTLGPRVGVDPTRTLIIGPTHLYDPLVSDPISWLNTQIARFIGTQEDLGDD